MSAPPRPASLIAFMLGFALVLCVAEGPLWALVGRDAALHDRVNLVRREHHLNPLQVQPELAGVAQAHADHMARAHFFSHVDPGGLDPLDRVRAAGIVGFRLLAENLGASSIDGERIQAVIEAWLRSPSHRENLLNPAFNSTGIGVADAPDGRTVYVQLYATFEEPAD